MMVLMWKIYLLSRNNRVMNLFLIHFSVSLFGSCCLRIDVMSAFICCRWSCEVGWCHCLLQWTTSFRQYSSSCWYVVCPFRLSFVSITADNCFYQYCVVPAFVITDVA